jgi:secretion/DNA translocation related TadE-like protein
MTARQERGRPARRSHEAGSITVIAAGVMVVLAVMALATADVARALLVAARAQNAADAAALAAVQEQAEPTGSPPVDVAGRFALANGATLVACDCPPDGTGATVTVRMPVDGLLLLRPGRTVTATARAELDLPASSANPALFGGRGGEVTRRMAGP